MEDLPLTLQELEELEKKLLEQIKEERQRIRNCDLQLKAIEMVVEKYPEADRDLGRLRRRIRAYEKRLETTPNLPPRRERLLIEKISQLRKEYRELLKVIRLRKKKERLENLKSETDKHLAELREKLTAVRKKIKLYKMLGRSPDLPEDYVGTIGDVGIFEESGS